MNFQLSPFNFRSRLSPLNFQLSTGILAFLVLSYTLIFTAAAWRKYDALLMGFDLGVHEQVLWNTAHGRIAATSAFANTESYLGIDTIPTELLLAPIYALAPSAYTMLFVQTVAVALGAVPAYLIGLRVLPAGPSDRARALFALGGASAYLLLIPVQFANLYEFQIRVFATTFLLAAWAARQRGRVGWFWVWALLALGCRNEVGFVLAGMGALWLWDAWRGGRKGDAFAPRVSSLEHDPVATNASPLPPVTPRASATLESDGRRSSVVGRRSSVIALGLLPILVGLGWVALSLGVLVPAFRNGQPSLYLTIIYGQFGATTGEIIRTVLTRPDFVLQYVFLSPLGPARLRYLLELLLPLALVLLRPRYLLLAAPILTLNLLSNTPNIHASVRYHYNALIVPFLLIGALEGAALLWRWLAPRWLALRSPVWAGALLLALALLGNLWLRTPLINVWTQRVDRERNAAALRLLAQVPPDAALTATSKLGAQAARRERLFYFPGNVIYPQEKVTLGEYLIVDSARDQLRCPDDATPLAQCPGSLLLTQLAESGAYVRLAEERGVSLWRRAAR